MAFCSECGKSNADQAMVCDGCGKPIRGAAKAAAPVRFKGTMIMGATVPKPAATPAVTPAPVATPTAPAHQPNLAFQATMMGPITAPGASAPPPAAAIVPAFATPGAPTAPKVSAKGTMIGGMGGLPGAIQPPGPPAAAEAPSPALGSIPASGPPLAAVAPDVAVGASGEQPGAPRLEINYGGYGAAPTKSNKTWLWVAVGIVGALGFACVATGLALYFGAVSFGDKIGDAMTDFAKRAQVTVTLSSIHTACAAGDCNQAADLFHPGVRAALLPQANTVTPAVIGTFGDVQKSEAANLAGSGDEGVAEELDIDPAACVRLSAGGAKVIGCAVAAGVSQIIAIENLGAIN